MGTHSRLYFTAICSMLKFTWIVLLVTFSFSLCSQDYFNQYQPLRSSGNIPTDFYKSTTLKIKEDKATDLSQLSKRYSKYFVSQIHYSIDEILRSGDITFGDSISNYLQDVGNRLLKTSPEVQSKIRFYSFNSPVANAFSTRQGIIFLSTGLLAQFTTEAQLAYVLAHEIIHFEKGHVFEHFKFRTKARFNSANERNRLLSNYSKENELEADKLAIKLMHDAGYNPKQVAKTFDVLLYAHLPFEELVFSTQYLGSKQMQIPLELPIIRPKQIAVNSGFNDYLKSHPNIDKRKLNAENEIAKFSLWKETNFFDSTRFFFIRNIARFEYVRKKVYFNEPIEALYAIYILEKEFPTAAFLQEMKAQAWLDIMKLTDVNAKYSNSKVKWISQKFLSKNNFEGQISILSQFLNSISSTAKLAVGLRQIRDIYLKDSTSLVIKEAWNRAVQLVAESYIFPLESFSENNYNEAKSTIEKLSGAEERNQPIATDKYSIITNQAKGVNATFRIDSTKFYLYGISDLKSDSTFLHAYSSFKKLKYAEDEKKERFNNLTDVEQQKETRQFAITELHQNLDSVLILRPAVFDTKFNQSINVFKTLKTESLLHQAILENAKSLGIYPVMLDFQDTLSRDVAKWNDIATLNESVSRAIQDNDYDAFVADRTALDRIQKKYGIQKLLFVEFQHTYKPKFTFGNVTLFTILLPVGLFYFPIELLSAHLSDWQFYLVDLKSGKLVVNRGFFANEPSTKNALGSRVFNMLHEFKIVTDE